MLQDGRVLKKQRGPAEPGSPGVAETGDPGSLPGILWKACRHGRSPRRVSAGSRGLLPAFRQQRSCPWRRMSQVTAGLDLSARERLPQRRWGWGSGPLTAPRDVRGRQRQPGLHPATRGLYRGPQRGSALRTPVQGSEGEALLLSSFDTWRHGVLPDLQGTWQGAQRRTCKPLLLQPEDTQGGTQDLVEYLKRFASFQLVFSLLPFRPRPPHQRKPWPLAPGSLANRAK